MVFEACALVAELQARQFVRLAFRLETQPLLVHADALRLKVKLPLLVGLLLLPLLALEEFGEAVFQWRRVELVLAHQVLRE